VQDLRELREMLEGEREAGAADGGSLAGPVDPAGDRLKKAV